VESDEEEDNEIKLEKLTEEDNSPGGNQEK